MTQMQNEMDDMKRRISHMDALDSKCQVQEEKCRFLFLDVRCGSLGRTVQILNKNQKWECSAPSIPSSYWANEHGFEEDYIDKMEGFIERMKNETYMMRGDKICRDIDFYCGGGRNVASRRHVATALE